ncbi:hypothetical protein RA210_U10145 [Rubrivivax sp. A210]|nr:hypothetical protein RA210_U10145 [Rubrivivax sp. A210]
MPHSGFRLVDPNPAGTDRNTQSH